MGTKTPMVPTFPDAMENFRKDIGYRLYCHLPGAIDSFDRTNGTATVKVGLKQVVPDYTAPTGSKLVDYPPLPNVPVFLLQGGGASIGADPKKGDPCLICVIDRNIDAWFQNGGQQAPLSPRAHNLADSFCFVGFNPLTPPLVSARLAGEVGIADAVAKIVINEAHQVILSGAGVTMMGGGGISLVDVLVTAFTALATALTSLAAALTAIASKCTADATLDTALVTALPAVAAAAGAAATASTAAAGAATTTAGACTTAATACTTAATELTTMAG